MAHGPKSKKRKAFKVRNAVREVQKAGFAGIDEALNFFKRSGSKFYHVDDDLATPAQVRGFWAAFKVRHGLTR